MMTVGFDALRAFLVHIFRDVLRNFEPLRN